MSYCHPTHKAVSYAHIVPLTGSFCDTALIAVEICLLLTLCNGQSKYLSEMFIFSRSTSCGLNKSIYTEEFIIVQRKPERETGNSVPLVVFAKASIIITIAHTYGYRDLFKLLTPSVVCNMSHKA